MNKNKRGQFYLIAALVVISLIISYAAISNYSTTEEYTRTYDLAEELEIESAEVLDYGVYQNIEIPQMQGLLEGFIQSYSEEIGDLDELYFLFGNHDEIVFVGYQQLKESLEAGIDLDESRESLLKLSEETVTSTHITSEKKIRRVTVDIDYLDGTQSEYKFKLKKGNNFYFILSDVIGREKYTEAPDSEIEKKDECKNNKDCERD